MSANACYTDDLVYKFDENNRITFGIVSDNYEEDHEDSCDEFPMLQKGQVQVTWSNSSKEQICRQSEVHLMSRRIYPGDIVQRFEEGKETQRGYCKDTKQFATVQVVESDKVIEHIPETRMCFVKPFNVGDYVCLGDKFGRIERIDERIRMQSKCGSVVEVRSSVNNYNTGDYWDHSINGVYSGFGYPGQAVKCKPMRLKDPKWLKKSKVMRRKMESSQTLRIQRIDICSIKVSWYTSSGKTEYAELKEEEIKRLKVLPHSEHLVGMGDRRLLKLKPSDISLEKHEWIEKKSLQLLPDSPTCSEAFGAADDWYSEEDEEESDNNGEITTYMVTKMESRKKNFPPKMNKFSTGSIVTVKILCTDSTATVVWQDGTEEKDIPTTQLYYSCLISLDDYDFLPGEWVVPNAKDNSDKYGVIRKVNFIERTAEVKWFTHCNSEPQELEMNEQSVYDLKKHPKYEFRPGNVVKAKPTQVDRMGKVIDSCAEGYVIVQWLDGTVENCWPHVIENFDEYCSDFNEDSYSWETESIESFGSDVTDETNLQNMAASVDSLRKRVVNIRQAFKQRSFYENFFPMIDLVSVYDDSSVLDKYLDTSFFCPESKHVKGLLREIKKLFGPLGIDSGGKLSRKLKKIMRDVSKLESKDSTPVESNIECSGAESRPLNTDNSQPLEKSCEKFIFDLLAILETFMEIAHNNITRRIGCRQAIENKIQNNDPKPEDLTLTSTELAKPIECVLKNDSFSIIEEAPDTHRYFTSKFAPKDQHKFLNALQKEYKLLKESLPVGVWVKTYDNRMDLLSVMIRGPAKTPYEDGLFLFDMKLGPDYPRHPPSVHYISYISEIINPNLYVEGKVCVSLLGTWMGKGSEVWGSNSTLLQLIVSIQGLILVAEPYYNEAGYERQTHTQQGYENSRTYNEFVILKLVQSMTELLNAAPKVFQREVLAHFEANGEKMCERLMKYCEDEPLKPEFPLLPVSKGLKLSLGSALERFRHALKKAGNEA